MPKRFTLIVIVFILVTGPGALDAWLSLFERFFGEGKQVTVNFGDWYQALFPLLGLLVLLFGIWWARPNKVVVAASKDTPKESLIKAQVAAKELLTLKSDANTSKVFSSGLTTIVDVGDKYKAAIKILQREHSGKKTKRGTKINSLITSLHKGKDFLDVCKRSSSIADFKSELDKNSEEIIRQIDALIGDKVD